MGGWEFLVREYPKTKVPRVTVFFWIIKICCTTVGETLSDAVNGNAGLGLGITAAIFFPILMAFLVGQMCASRYIHPVYWGAVVLTSICGTIATDGLHDNLNVDLWIEILVFGFLMLSTFLIWFLVERTLAIHSIYTLRRELFYWLAIFWTFAMGTAVGDQIQASFIYAYLGNDPSCMDDPDCSDTSITPWSPDYYIIAPAPEPAAAPAPSPSPSPSPAPAPAPSEEYIPCCFYQYKANFPQLLGMWLAIMGFLLVLWFGLRLAGLWLNGHLHKPPPSTKNWRLSGWLPEGLCPVGSPQEIFLFWVAYILTRPMGATIGDFFSSDNSAVAAPPGYPQNLMTSPDAPPGLGWGPEVTSVMLFAIILVSLFFCMETKYDVMSEEKRGYENPRAIATSQISLDVAIPSGRT